MDEVAGIRMLLTNQSIDFTAQKQGISGPAVDGSRCLLFTPGLPPIVELKRAFQRLVGIHPGLGIHEAGQRMSLMTPRMLQHAAGVGTVGKETRAVLLGRQRDANGVLRPGDGAIANEAVETQTGDMEYFVPAECDIRPWVSIHLHPYPGSRCRGAAH